MTTIRHIDPFDGSGYYLPLKKAGDNELRAFVAEYVREFLWRQGIQVDHIPDELLMRQIRNTFATVRARDGRISSAIPVQSG